MENKIKELEEKLLRKEQECEKKDKDIKFLLEKLDLSNNRIQDCELYWDKEKKNLKQQLDQLKEQLEAYKTEAEEGKEINAELKAENDKYSLFIEKLCDYAELECDDEEQAMRTLSDLASQMNKARWIIDRYKQTLTEIKELLLKTPADSQESCINAKSVILQKISEVKE